MSWQADVGQKPAEQAAQASRSQPDALNFVGGVLTVAVFDTDILTRYSTEESPGPWCAKNGQN
jgi:predicted nucleic acid-binding Zn ribbon protein